MAPIRKRDAKTVIDFLRPRKSAKGAAIKAPAEPPAATVSYCQGTFSSGRGLIRTHSGNVSGCEDILVSIYNSII